MEERCPFCGVELVDAPAPVTVAAFGLGVAMLVACSPAKPQTTDSSESSSTTTTTTGESSTGTSTSSTTAPTSGATSSTSSTGPCDTACTSSDEAGGFIYGAPGDFQHGGTIECDVFKQDCASGEKCTAWNDNGGGSWNATKCVPVTGDKVPGDECKAEGGGTSGIDNCEAGAMCYDVDAMNTGICRALCTGTPDAPTCDGNFSCAIVNDGVLNICLPGCDPLLQDCPGKDLCLPIGDGFICVIDVSGDMGQTNDPCEFANSCDKGLVCLNTASASSACMQGSPGCCQPFCDFTAMDPCPNPDQKCVQWFDPMMPIPPGFEDVGVCAIPM